MNLREWISELNAATTERDIVAVMDAFVKQMRHVGDLPEQCLPREAGSAGEIRRTAKCLAELRIDASASPDTRDLYQKLLILFSLAVDRIAMLEARGLLVPINPLRRPGYQPRPAY
jgi:hypothetical protein